MRALTEELEIRTKELQVLHAEREREREAMELQRYRVIEAAREKWEAREQRLADDLDKMREELIDYKDKTGSVESTAMSEQMAAAERELQEAREEVKGLERDKEELQLERDELKAELALMQTRVLRLEGTGSVEDRCGGLWEAPLSARREWES